MNDYHALLKQWTARRQELLATLDAGDPSAADELVLVDALVTKLKSAIADSDVEMQVSQATRIGPNGKSA